MVKKDKVFQITAHTFMIILALLCIMPFILIISASFTSEEALIRDGYRIIPVNWSLDAYRFIFNNMANIWRAYIVSIGITIIGTASNIILTTLLAYPLSRRDLPGKNIISFFLFFSLLFNGGLIPSYIMWTRLFHIKNTYAALLFPNLLMNAVTVIMMRTNFSVNIPDEVIEAARIDGANEWIILGRVVIPMAKPIIATMLFMVGLIYWNDWTNGVYFITKDIYYNIPVLLNKMLQDTQYMLSEVPSGMASTGMIPSNSIKMAIAVIAVFPVLGIYPFFQRYFVKGITVGAVKG